KLVIVIVSGRRRSFGTFRPLSGHDQFASLLSDLDTDGDGLVTLDEFMAGKPDEITESQASQLFSLLDTSGTGSLSA
ncbi:hypothetical protein ACC756_39345, partial [Rhizobium ruizarguesonis]